MPQTTAIAATITIVIGSNNWPQRAYRAINQGKRLKLVLKGPQAGAAATAIRQVAPPAPIPPGAHALGDPATVTITVAIIVGVIAVIGLGTLAAVCLFGINKGYQIKAKHKVNGPWPFDDELVLDLQPPV